MYRTQTDTRATLKKKKRRKIYIPQIDTLYKAILLQSSTKRLSYRMSKSFDTPTFSAAARKIEKREKARTERAPDDCCDVNSFSQSEPPGLNPLSQGKEQFSLPVFCLCEVLGLF